MHTMPQEKKEFEATISFRCPEEWKRLVGSKVKLRGETMQSACIEAISKHLRIPAPKTET
jgi:hypothetical protein